MTGIASVNRWLARRLDPPKCPPECPRLRSFCNERQTGKIARSTVIARAIAQRVAVVIIQMGQHKKVFTQRFQRLQNPRELKLLAFARWPPPINVNDAIGHV